ncbi:hypothetical protein GCM10010383_49930 [Streptomyces lomondensis]|uniref:ATP-grasp domain-containing protein n=1 Tax=Streptomyces lomondensis TaxID=68229 RepID=A0ABQ2XEQ7_9ACTN|nr:hypothetical protein GCM10010383_49930 [Streptomyces lomondensis]
MNSQAVRQPTYILCKWKPKLAERLVSRARVHIILDQYDVDHAHPDPDVLARAASVHRVSDFNALEELATIAADLWLTDPHIDRIISFAEFSQLGATALASMLGMEEEPIRQIAARDKRLMKHFVNQAGVRTAQYWSLPDPANPDAVRALGKEVKYPAVVKPAAGSGTEHTTKVHDPDELAEAAARFAAVEEVDSHQLIVEEFISGSELHIDACWDGDSARFFVVSEYFAPRLASIAADVEDGSRVINREDEPALHDELMAMNRAVNRALRTDRVVTHMEVFRTPEGELVFSEIATRIGGGWAPVMLTQALGQDVWTSVADVFLDGETAAEPRPAARHLATVHIRPEAPGVIDSLPTEEDFDAVPGILDHQILCEVGEDLRMDSASDWCVFAVIGADTAVELEERVRSAHRRLNVTTKPAG